METKSRELETKELRSFGLTLAAAMVILFGGVLPWLFSYAFPYWPWLLAGGLTLWALFSARTLAPLYKVWMKVGDKIGWVNTRIILGLVFYTTVMPMGFVMRLLGKDPMRREFNKQLASYRIPSTKRSQKHMERPF